MSALELVGWNEAQRKLKEIENGLIQARHKAKTRIGVYMVGRIRKGIRNQMPGGKGFKALHPFTVAQKGSSKALIRYGDLVSAVTHVVDGESVFVGVRRTARGKKAGSGAPYLANIAEIQERGIIIAVTPKMRAWLHAHGLHLKPATKAVRIPPRPFIRPVFEAERKKAMQIYQNAVKAVLK